MKKIPGYLIIVLTILSITILQLPIATIYKANYIEFYDKNDNLILTEIENKPGNYIHLNELNDYTINAFIAFEDKNFYSHKGFDPLRMFKSFLTNISNFSFKEGGSTITQQYARSLFLNNKKSIVRKIKEFYYTLKLEKKYTKNQILEGYLNTIYLGHGCYGIEAASLYYFNKSSKDLTLAESAILASLPSSPSSSSPFINYEKSKSRKELVLEAMKKENYISLFQYKDAINTDIILNHNSYAKANLHYYLDQVKSEIEKLNLSDLRGLKIYTNIDMQLYEKISELVNKYANNNTQVSLIVLENNTNKILFDIGGFDYSKSEYNRSVNAKRQIGSTIKTFLYSFALENNFSLDTQLVSEPTTFKIKNYGTYSPSNSNNIYANNKITMKEAYAVSDNIYATKTLLLLGSDNFASYLKRFNLLVEESVPSIALGSSQFTLLELIKAYSVYANEGYYYNYSFINKVTDNLGNVLYQNKIIKNQIINKNIVNKMKLLMQTPFQNNNYYTKPTLANYNIQGYYGKSGSTSNDSYLILFNDEYTIGVWIGTDDNDKLYDYTTSKFLSKDITKILKKSIA